MSKAQRTLDKRMRDMDRRAKAIGSAIGVSLGIGITAALTGTVVALKGAIDNMDKLRDSSIRLGIGVETLSAFQFAAQQTGTDIDQLGQGFKILAKNMADALNPKSGKAQIFEALGIEVEDATGKLKSFEQIIPEIADAFKQLEDGTTKAALAQELFGKNGIALTEFLNQGGQGIKELIDRAKELGVTFDQDAANSADAFKDKLAELKAVALGLSIQVAEKLLPKLNELVDWAVEFVRDGSNAADIANSIADGFEVLSTAANFAGKVLGTLNATVRGVTSDVTALVLALRAADAARSFDFGGAKQLMEQAKLARQMASEQSAAIEKIWSAAEGPKKNGPSFRGVSGDVSGDGLGSRDINRNLLNRALGGVKDKPAKKSSGKSDAEREAERLAKAINQMTDAQREWQTELDGTGNKIADDYAKRLDEITEKSEDFIQNGIPKEKVAQFREEMTKLADGLKAKETGEFLKEFGLQTQEMIASANGASTATIDYARAIDELDKALKSGIISQDEYAKRAEALADVRDASALQVLRDIKTEGDLLGTSIEYQDTYNKLKFAGVDANSAFGQSIIEANHALHEQAKAVADQTELMDDFRSGLADAFSDFASGAKSAKEAFTDFFDDMAAKILRMIAEKWIERAFGEMGTTGGANSGGSGWGAAVGQFFGAIFGGGKASGGMTQAGKFYRVNENGPELLSVGGRDYLMMGSQSGNVTPNRNIGGNAPGMALTINMRTDNETRTRDQIAGIADHFQRRQRIRNGKRT